MNSCERKTYFVYTKNDLNTFYVYLHSEFFDDPNFRFAGDWTVEDRPDYERTVIYKSRIRHNGYVEIDRDVWLHDAYDYCFNNEEVLVCWVKKRARRSELVKLLFKDPRRIENNDLETGTFQAIPDDFIRRCRLPCVVDSLCHEIPKKNILNH